MNAEQPEKRLPPANRNELAAGFGIASTRVGAAAAFVILILNGFSALAKVYDSDGSAASVQALHNAAHDGDTITIPAGTFSWTVRVDITKGITLRGNTNITGAGTSGATADDQTIILDDVVNRFGLIKMAVPAGKVAHVTGITFGPGALTGGFDDNGIITVDSPDNDNSKGNRISYCHFKDGPNMDSDLTVYNGYGVMDHCLLERSGGRYFFIFREKTYGGGSNDFGNGAWADYPWFGTDKFFFIENCTAKRTNNYSICDSFMGGKWVIRYNYFDRGSLQDHGTEGGQARGHRAREVYNNTFNHTSPQPSLGFRSGTGLVHDNIRTGKAPKNNNFGTCSNYRVFPGRAFPVFGTADGTSIWDMNVTDVDPGGEYPTLDKSKQHFVEGHSGYLFHSGTSTSTSTISGDTGTFTDNTKNWTPNMWVNYSVRNMTCSTCGFKGNPPSDTESMASYIISNTSNTITYAYYPATDTNGHLLFAPGDQYQIHRVLEMMDECGHGKTDLIGSAGANKPINMTVTPHRPYYAHSKIEAIFGWNNVFQPTGAAMKIGEGAGPISKEGVDVFGNLGKGLVGTPTQVSTHYDAARNGVAYTGPFQYPHPLVTGASTPTPSGTPRSQQHLQKKKKNSKKLKRRNWPKNRRVTWLNALLVEAIS